MFPRAIGVVQLVLSADQPRYHTDASQSAVTKMTHRLYCTFSATLFAVVAIAHALRLANGWAVQVETTTIPMLVSVIGMVVPGFLAILGFRLSRSGG